MTPNEKKQIHNLSVAVETLYLEGNHLDIAQQIVFNREAVESERAEPTATEPEVPDNVIDISIPRDAAELLVMVLHNYLAEPSAKIPIKVRHATRIRRIRESIEKVLTPAPDVPSEGEEDRCINRENGRRCQNTAVYCAEKCDFT